LSGGTEAPSTVKDPSASTLNIDRLLDGVKLTDDTLNHKPLNRKTTITNIPQIVEIPEGLTQEAEEQFKAVMEENVILKDQVKQIKKTLRGGPVLNYRQGRPKKTEADIPADGIGIKVPEKNGKAKPPLKSIREFCLKCLGGPKAVKECPSIYCPLHTLRFGKNPDHTKTLTDKERKRRSDLARKSFF